MLDNGRQAWEYEGALYPNVGLNAVIGRPKEQWSMDPANFDEMRRGCWDIDARIDDMDRAGIAASVCFPSLIAGFAGAVFSRSKNPELGLACVRAWNDWHLEVWAGTHPGRIIPTQITWLNDPAVAADDGARERRARASAPSASPSSPRSWACRPRTQVTGTRCSRRARRPTRSSASTRARHRGRRFPATTHPSSYFRACSR